MRLPAFGGVSGDDDKSITFTIGERRSIVNGVDGEHKSIMSVVVADDVSAEDGVLGIVPVETIVFVGVRKSIIGCSSCWTILLTKP